MWTSVGASGPISGKIRGSIDSIGRFDGGGLYEWVISGAVGYRINDHVTLWAGYVHKTAYANNVTSIEQRARQEVAFEDIARIGPVRIGGRLRVEERWVEAWPGTGWRVRPQLKLTLPLRQDGPALVAAAEGFVNLGTGAGQRDGYDRTRVARRAGAARQSPAARCRLSAPIDTRRRHRQRRNTRAQFPLVGTQLPWNPGGTRCGMRMLATGAASKSIASTITRSVVSLARSITSPTSQPSPSGASAARGTKTNSPG
ncbi:MAG: DUF2490 domain-containing protein [Sphingomonas sp.]|nr:MAG: DUF2490 domain-containing protein [Sphingomonas sp.]